MSSDDWALALSGAALAVSIIVGGWQIVKYLLEGGRIGISFRRGWLDDDSLLEAPFREQDLPEDWGLRTPRLYAEVAVMKVTNKGRTAVTVSNPSFDVSKELHGLQRLAYWRRRRWLRWTIGTALYSWRNASTAQTVRLEPFDAQTFVMDAQNLPLELTARQRPTRVRGSVEVAGKRFRRRSSRRRALVLKPGQLTIGMEATVESVAYAVTKRMEQLTEEDEGRPIPAFVASYHVQKAHKAGEPLTFEHIGELLDEARPRQPGDASNVTLAIAIDRALQMYGLTEGAFNSSDD